MIVSKPVKILVGFLTAFTVLYPFLIMPIFMMIFIFGSGFPFLNPQSVPDPSEIKFMIPFIFVFYPLMMCFSVVQLGLQILYIIHIIKNKALTDTFRILFTIGTFMLSYVAMPIYFIIYLWKDNPQETHISQAS